MNTSDLLKNGIPDISIAILHADQLDKNGKHVTTALTMIDVHDIARSCCTFGLASFYVSHPSPLLRKLARTLRLHWQEGFGLTYNPNRSEALGKTEIVASLDEAIASIDLRTGKLPRIVATSAHHAAEGEPPRFKFSQLRQELASDLDTPHLILLGTGWGLSRALLERADIFLEPICGPTPYNHLSVRAAAAIILDRLLGKHEA